MCSSLASVLITVTTWCWSRLRWHALNASIKELSPSEGNSTGNMIFCCSAKKECVVSSPLCFTSPAISIFTHPFLNWLLHCLFTLRWRLSRSLGGVKTDEVFARLLLNLWENNRRFINAPKRPVVVEEAKVDPSDDAPVDQKSSPTLVISKDAKGVFIPSRASTTDDDNEAS